MSLHCASFLSSNDVVWSGVEVSALGASPSCGGASSLVEVFGGLRAQQVDGLHLQRCTQTAEGLRIGTPAHVFEGRDGPLAGPNQHRQFPLGQSRRGPAGPKPGQRNSAAMAIAALLLDR